MATPVSYNDILSNPSYIGKTFNKFDNEANNSTKIGKLKSIDSNSIVFYDDSEQKDYYYTPGDGNTKNGYKYGFFSNKNSKNNRFKILPSVDINSGASDILKTQPLFYPVQTTGGRRRKSNKNQENGGSVLGTLATPGVLLVANEVYKRKTPRNKTPKR